MAPAERDDLQQWLERYPPDRYPVQHATAQFHLGSLLLHAGQPSAARDALSVARDLFARAGMRLEEAKATVMAGIAWREDADPAQAATAFAAAAAALAGLDQPAERAAAEYNLGLARQDLGDTAGARAAWGHAAELFREAGLPARAAAAARDHGASLLAAGDPAAALPLLEQAVAEAAAAGDEPGVGAAANVLGLARLATGDAAGAVEMLRRALAAVPRAVRAGEHAMVKANLALAYDQLGDAPRARLAARQALAVSTAAEPVRRQAAATLDRLDGSPAGAAADLLAVLDADEPDRWAPAVREEALRVLDGPADERRDLVAGYLDGVLARPGRSHELAETLLRVILELPPRPYDLLVAAVVEACTARAPEATDRLRAVLDSALARFPLPQWQRLLASLDAAAVAAGRPSWR